MTDERKSLRDGLLKILSGLTLSVPETRDGGTYTDDTYDDDKESGGRPLLDASTARALISAVFQRAGKGKDEVVQIVAREIGAAVAAMLKEPLSQLAKHQKLQISFEFVPKNQRHANTKQANDADTHAPSNTSPDPKISNKRSIKSSSRRKKAAIRG